MEIVKTVEEETIINMDDNVSDKEKKILIAAIRIMSEKGFRASRTSEIAKEAGVSEGTLFRYYPKKKDLLLALLPPLILSFFQPIITEMFSKSNAPKSSTLKYELKHFFSTRLSLLDDNKGLLKIIILESIYYPELQKSIQKLMTETVFPSLEQMIMEQIEKKHIKKMSVTTVSRILMSQLLGYFILSSYFPDQYPRDDDKEINEMVDIILNGIKR
ncbi:TetR/AcrR family transcriptional regulator [Evansella tamaricis]|uniref:TetR/AcrR family transcriptional regulator n=1 Tax=Evansella tamaricis TaxID=2069301 RepID=A0ABS6JKL0_9BACI|nr:TetR/AcrR family transcriptional regulator [Evansella tamaricis]MBU9713362.1 TetR/AcrR family transcriptional regulator [Evansella tamaricis]